MSKRAFDKIAEELKEAVALTREQQIDLMTNAKERIESRVKTWIKNPQIRASLKRTAGESEERYSLSTQTAVKVRRCG